MINSPSVSSSFLISFPFSLLFFFSRSFDSPFICYGIVYQIALSFLIQFSLLSFYFIFCFLSSNPILILFQTVYLFFNLIVFLSFLTFSPSISHFSANAYGNGLQEVKRAYGIESHETSEEG